jgi:ubiquinone/menaquinone biosynthesis C-methylase UbiE
MLDHTMRRAREIGISNIVPTRGDAQALPYADGHFDSAYLVTTLGEVLAKDVRYASYAASLSVTVG